MHAYLAANDRYCAVLKVIIIIRISGSFSNIFCRRNYDWTFFHRPCTDGMFPRDVAVFEDMTGHQDGGWGVGWRG